MIITMMKPVSIDVKPGDQVELMYDGCGKPITLERRRYTAVLRLTERDGLVYAVFYNNTWRPISSYGRTWKKVEA